MTNLIPAEPIETTDHLAGAWKIVQLKRGHRFSADDLLTAWTAAHALPTARTVCDLGAGIGSVGLLAIWRLEAGGGLAHLTMVEVQALSHRLARKTVALNSLEDRVEAVLGDVRVASVLDGTRLYDLVTGSPPYLPEEQGVKSLHPQKASARFELHGDVFDYCAAAARVLAPVGRFVFCHAARDLRPETAISRAGLVLQARCDVVFRADQPPLISLFTCGREGAEERPVSNTRFVIRDDRGAWTEEYLAMRADMGTVVWNRPQPVSDL